MVLSSTSTGAPLMKTINMIAETIQQILSGIQKFASAFCHVGEMTDDAVANAAAQARAEQVKALKVIS
jgi:hypothetical protein